MAHKFGDVFVCGREHDVLCGAGLDDAPVLQDRDAIPEAQRLVQIMAHEQDRLFDARLQCKQLILQFAANQRIERGKRLVHQEDVRVRGKGARETDALLHTARQFADVPLGPLR